MKRWLRKFEDAMAASAFAEAGEFETAREIIRGQRKILLALTGENSDLNAFRYALNMCKRINVELDILYLSDGINKLLDEFQAELEKEGITYHLIEGNGCIKDEILKYTKKHTDILFVVIEASEALDTICKKTEKGYVAFWENLGCPLVVVSELATT